MNEQAVHDWIRKQIAANDVVLFMKGTKQMPQCGFSGQVAQILQYVGVDYKDVNVLEDMSIREGIKSFTQWPTIPQLYVKGEFVGGCDIIREMFQQGELQELLAEKGVKHTPTNAIA
jgi:monothiol glutaredoxin